MYTVTVRTIQLAIIVLLLYSGNCYGKPKNPKTKIYRAKLFNSLERKKIKGILDEVMDSSIYILSRHQRIKISSSSITKLVIKRKGNVGRGAAFGAGSGMVIGILIGFASGDDKPCSIVVSPSFPAIACTTFTAEEKALTNGVLLGLAGAILGTIFGAATNAEIIVIDRSQKIFHNNISTINQYASSRP